MTIQDAALQPGNEFKGKVALVTGATRNIGRSIALALAATVRFLCGPASSFITGQPLHVNGGQIML